MHSSRSAQYTELFQTIKESIEGERDAIANAANVSALIFEHLNSKIDAINKSSNIPIRVNWCGFYFVKPSSGTAVHHGSGAHAKIKSELEAAASSFSSYQLVLGPFQGKAACIRINYGDGVCGTTWKRKETIVVSDVHKFDGHIACDDSSNSEIVVPIFNKDRDVVGVLDIDSRVFSNFDEVDRIGLERIVDYLMSQSPFDMRHS